jgi:hypothetical protein
MQGLGYMPDLRAIEVTSNKLVALPIDLCQTQSIRVLTLDENPLRMPPVEVIVVSARKLPQLAWCIICSRMAIEVVVVSVHMKYAYFVCADCTQRWEA